jgi:hypothetical protein
VSLPGLHAAGVIHFNYSLTTLHACTEQALKSTSMFAIAAFCRQSLGSYRRNTAPCCLSTACIAATQLLQLSSGLSLKRIGLGETCIHVELQYSGRQFVHFLLFRE